MTLSTRTAIAAALLVATSRRQSEAFVPLSSVTRTSSSALSMSKNADRARMERNLEELMDNDWRAFRARLVLQEKREAQEKIVRPKSPRTHTYGDAKLERQDKLGSLFAGVISSVLKNGGNGGDGPAIGGGDEDGESVDGSKKRSIFDGDAVGGATSSSILPAGCTDPFVSPAEMPAHIPTERVIKLDKHRWAHPIPSVEPGCVLVANERLGGVFHQTIVLIIDHHEGTGSTGIVINRPMPGNLLKVASETPSNVDLSLKLAFNTATVSYGGPVMQEEYSILHGYGEVEGSKKVAPGVFVGGSEELMNEVRRHNFHPDQALFVKGHAAWVPGQLSREIAKGVWYPAAVSADFILRYAGAMTRDDDNAEDLWSDILTCMGGRHMEIAEQHSGRGDMRMMP